jgi:hypothetical protein
LLLNIYNLFTFCILSLYLVDSSGRMSNIVLALLQKDRGFECGRKWWIYNLIVDYLFWCLDADKATSFKASSLEQHLRLSL